jgi:hypothetical protein
VPHNGCRLYFTIAPTLQCAPCSFIIRKDLNFSMVTSSVYCQGILHMRCDVICVNSAPVVTELVENGIRRILKSRVICEK